MNITIEIKNRIARAVNNEHTVSFNKGDTVEFLFDEEWKPNDLSAVRTARFIFGDEYTDVVFRGSVCEMPEINYNGYIYIGVYWSDLKSSSPARLFCNESILSKGGVPKAPSNNVYNQLIDMINRNGYDGELDDAINAAIESARENGMLDGEQGPQGEKGEPGKDGTDGKSAYDYAKDGGYSGTEAEFAKALADLSNSGTVNVATETPQFNLTELGLPALTIGGNAAKLTTDTADIMAALSSGAVKFTFAVNMGNILPVSCVMTNIAAMGSYVCSYIFDFNGVDINLVLEIYEGGITAVAKVLFESVVTEIEAISEKLNGIDTLLDLINGEVV